MRTFLTIAVCACLAGCLGMPSGVEPVENFEADRYLGHWYEIARLDHSFERGLSNVTATYTARDDGGIDVVNRGYSARAGECEEARGRAYFVDGRDRAYLKVSFFGPFYGSYVVFDLDREGYEHAFVSGPDTDYLWLLARTPTVSPGVIEAFRRRARALGFDTDELIYPTHDRDNTCIDKKE